MIATENHNCRKIKIKTIYKSRKQLKINKSPVWLNLQTTNDKWHKKNT